MSFAFHYLATHSAERDRLIREPEIMPRAVEEFIGSGGSIHGIPRTVTQEVELSGRTFCPGESVLVNYASANRDPAEFVDPDQCILDRQANRHLGFGAGVHRCLGSNLARLEFQFGIEQVLSRLPDYVLSPESGSGVPRQFCHAWIPQYPGDVHRGSAVGLRRGHRGSLIPPVSPTAPRLRQSHKPGDEGVNSFLSD